MKIILKDRLYFYGLQSSLVDALHDHFRIPNPAFAAVKKYSKYGTRFTKVPEYLCLADRLSATSISLPRGITLPQEKKFDSLLDIEIEDERVCLPKISFPLPALKLNNMQERLEKQFVAAISKEVSPAFLVVAGTAFGKTIGMLNITRLTRQPVLILTHRVLIRDVWLAEIKKFFAGKADVGCIQGKPSQWERGKHFTVAMEQTLHRYQDQLPELFKCYGCVIQDEAHLTPQPYIQGILNDCPALYRIGCTATPKARNQLHKIIYAVLGEPWFNESATSAPANQISINEIRFVHTGFKYESSSEVFDQNDLTEKLMQNINRNKLIVEKAIEDIQKGKRVLIVSSRVAHCETLVEMLKQRGLTSFLFIGSRPQGKEQFDQEVFLLQKGKHNLVVSTEQLIREGVNIPPLDRLHITMPLGSTSNTIQLCGRICRSHAGKEDAKVTVYVDGKVPSLRRRVSYGMLPAFRQLKISGIEKIWFI